MQELKTINMKRLSFLLVLMVAFATFAQNSGLGFNYQAVVRNVDGMLLANSDVSLRISLYPGQMASTPTWVETHNAHTDISGSFGINVGSGSRDANSNVTNYADIDFTAAYYWLKIEILEGNNWREVSFSQLPSSPYSEVAHNAVPSGMIVAFAGPTENIPAGWLLCDGSEVSRSQYINLYNAIGVAWGAGDNSTTFNLPDLRGMFLRGVAGTDTIGDPDAENRIARYNNGGNIGNNVGSYQGDAIRNITGAVRDNIIGYSTNTDTSNHEGSLNWIDVKSVGVRKGTSWDGFTGISFDASLVVPVGSDNRPKNAYVTYIIKI